MASSPTTNSTNTLQDRVAIVTGASRGIGKAIALQLASLIEAADIDRVNTRGTFLCMKEAANRVTRGGGGRIITMSSSTVASLKVNKGAYTASKAAVETMTKILAKELKVAPGPIATEMFFDGKSEEMVKKVVDDCPLGRLGKVEDVAPIVGFLASDAGEWVKLFGLLVVNGYV